MNHDLDTLQGKNAAWMQVFCAALTATMNSVRLNAAENDQVDFTVNDAVDCAWRAASAAEARAAKEHSDALAAQQAARKAAEDAIRPGAWYTWGDTPVQVVHRNSHEAWFSDGTVSHFSNIIADATPCDGPHAKPATLEDVVRIVAGLAEPVVLYFEGEGDQAKILDVRYGAKAEEIDLGDWGRLIAAGVPCAADEPQWLRMELEAAKAIEAQRFWWHKGAPLEWTRTTIDGWAEFTTVTRSTFDARPSSFLGVATPMPDAEWPGRVPTNGAASSTPSHS